MKKVLFVSAEDFSDPYVPNGGTYGSRLHLDTLASIPDVELTVLSLSRVTNGYKDGVYYIPATRNKLETCLFNICGYAAYLSPKAVTAVMDTLKKDRYDILFLDTSNFGIIAKKARKCFPHIKIVVFFHNVEYIYSFSKVKVSGLFCLPIFFASWYNETLSCKYSDTRIAINGRDKIIIQKKYKTAVQGVLPPYYAEYEPPQGWKSIKTENPLNVLFFGSWSHANTDCIVWFIENVLPDADIKLTVAGRGMEALRRLYPNRDKLEVMGAVETSEELYARSCCVINPVREGSGMKIKTGEALRYGKTIIGTQEAFAGYAITHGQEGYVCETPEDFIRAFNAIKEKGAHKFNVFSYNYFCANLRKENAVNNLRAILKGTSKNFSF